MKIKPKQVIMSKKAIYIFKITSDKEDILNQIHTVQTVLKGASQKGLLHGSRAIRLIVDHIQGFGVDSDFIL